MIRPEDARLQKMLEAIDEIGVTNKEREVIEAYLTGEATEDTLEQLEVRNLNKVSDNAKTKCRQCTKDLQNKKRYEEFHKFFSVLFALGKCTCSSCLDDLRYVNSDEFYQKINIEPAKWLAVYVDGTSSWICRTHNMEYLYNKVGKQLDCIVNAIEYCKTYNASSTMVLYTLYFLKKYPYGPCQFAQKNAGGGEKLSSIARLLNGVRGKETKGGVWQAQAKLDSADLKMMEQYEQIVTYNISALFQPSKPYMTEQWYEKVREELWNGNLSKSTLEQVTDAAVNQDMLRLLGGCAYINYGLSPRLYEFLKVCAKAGGGLMLEIMMDADCRGDFSKQAGDYDRIFGMNSNTILQWAANKGRYNNQSSHDLVMKIFAIQFRKNRQNFLDFGKTTTSEANYLMLEAVKREDAVFYQQLLNTNSGEQKAIVIRELVSRLDRKKEAADYLNGEIPLEDLYSIEDSIVQSNTYAGCLEWKALSGYLANYKDRDFEIRAMTLFGLCKLGNFFREPLERVRQKTNQQVMIVENLFKCLEEGRMDIAHQVEVVCIAVDGFWSDEDKNAMLELSIPVFTAYLKERREETTQAFANAGAYGRYFGLCVMEKQADEYQAEILGFSQDSSKLVKEKLGAILAQKPQWREKVTALLASKKAAERELAIRTLACWNQPKDREALCRLYESEKNAKVRTLLEGVLKIEVQGEGTVTPQVVVVEDLVVNLHKGGKKRSLAWAYETPFSEVHKKSGEVAGEEYLQAVFLCYASMNTVGVSEDARRLANELNEAEFAVYVNELFDKWMEQGAEAKKRWVLYAASIHGGSDIIKKLHHQIQEWPLNSRGAIAAEAVQALALNPKPQALLLVDGIARKFKFKQVKAAAGKALDFAASQLGLTREELEDKIVPNLGFDENMERHFDYGERSFTVTITPALEIEIFGEDGKRLKNLPAPGKKDDEEKATAAYEAFKDMKKQMKATVSSQKMRLEQALSSERLWTTESWQELFVKNPIMHQFAIGLIWGVYEEHRLVQSFRYMEDGSFNTEDEDEYALPEQGMIGLVHPIELTEESRETWKQQLEDYEIKQPFEQLGRAIYYRTAKEEEAQTLDRFKGMYINDLSLNGKLQQLGWYRGSVQDAGCFDTFYREDAGVGLGVELHFSGTYVACENEDVTVYEARFYKAGTIERGSYMYEEAQGDKLIPLKEVPERYFSEIVLQLTKATASSTEREGE